MKTLYQIYFISIIFLAVACFASCHKNKEEKYSIEVVISEGKLLSPEWLGHAIDSIFDACSRRLRPETSSWLYFESYSIKYQEEEYVILRMNFSFNMLDYFTCSGDRVKYYHDPYPESLMQAYMRDLMEGNGSLTFLFSVCFNTGTEDLCEEWGCSDGVYKPYIQRSL